MPDTTPASRFTGAVSRTRTATGMALRRRDARTVFAFVTAGYLAVYLWAIGHLAPGLGGFGVTVVSDPLSAFFRPALGPLSFTPVASVAVGPVTYLFSLNSLVGLGLAALVGLNLTLTYLAWTQPRACGLGQSSTGILASLPAILSGTACCGPVVLIVLGVQASGVLLTAFQFLLPVAALLLVGSLVLIGRQVDPR
ncbi:hypothetical protein OB920_18915 [Halobacteria archaeon HArc-gm2]|nr:hypothetical protein [Halobacteria archaeon HArc-gm2]